MGKKWFLCNKPLQNEGTQLTCYLLHRFGHYGNTIFGTPKDSYSLWTALTEEGLLKLVISFTGFLLRLNIVLIFDGTPVFLS